MSPGRPFQRRSRAPGTLRSEREKREMVVAFGIVFVLQLAIAVTLVVAAVQTYRVWRQGVPYLPPDVARIIPVSLALGAAIALFASARTFGRVRTLRRSAVEPPPAD